MKIYEKIIKNNKQVHKIIQIKIKNKNKKINKT